MLGHVACRSFENAVDRHILNPLFAPRSIVVFAGDPEADDAPTPMAATLRFQAAALPAS